MKNSHLKNRSGRIETNINNIDTNVGIGIGIDTVFSFPAPCSVVANLALFHHRTNMSPAPSTFWIAHFAPPPLQLCPALVVSCDSAALIAAAGEVRMFCWRLKPSLVMSERKQIPVWRYFNPMNKNNVLLHESTLDGFLSKKYRYRYRRYWPCIYLVLHNWFATIFLRS